MSLTRTTCPSCGAGLKSAAGFNPGQSVRCPKCSTAFAVPDPDFEEVGDEPAPPAQKKAPVRAAARNDDDDRPRRRRRPRDEDDDDDDDDDRPRGKGKKQKGYKSSPLRYAILGVLLVVLGVLAFLLYQKKQREKEDAAAPAPAANGDDADAPELRPRPQPVPRPNPNLGVGGEAPPQGGEPFRPVGNGPNAATLTRGSSNLTRIMLAMHNYHDTSGALPKAALAAGQGGAPLLSWRVALLPYLEQDALYKQFKLDEPWDGPSNKKLIPLMPKVYQGTLPDADGKTAFKVFAGPGSAFDPRNRVSLAGIADGTSNTIGVAEAGAPVEWTRPSDLPFDGRTPPRLVPPTGGDTILVGMLDGSTRRLSLARNRPDVILKAVLVADGEAVELE